MLLNDEGGGVMTGKFADKSEESGSKFEGVAEELKSSCVHFWLIDRPLGPTSPGMCKYCGKVREFSNDPVGQDRPG